MNTKEIKEAKINNTNIMIAEKYYRAMAAKDFAVMNVCLHPNVNFISPLVKMSGKEAVMDSAKKLSLRLESIQIRAKFSAENQVMLAYDFILPEPINTLRAAVLMEISDELITKIELFFDARLFISKA